MNITNAEQNYNLSTRSSHPDERSSHLGRLDDRLSRCPYRAQPRCSYRAQPRCSYRAQPRCQSDILWLRLSTLTTGPQKLDCLEKALQINPHNKQTLRLIERLNPERAELARMWISALSEIIDSV